MRTYMVCVAKQAIWGGRAGGQGVEVRVALDEFQCQNYLPFDMTRGPSLTNPSAVYVIPSLNIYITRRFTE